MWRPLKSALRERRRSTDAYWKLKRRCKLGNMEVMMLGSKHLSGRVLRRWIVTGGPAIVKKCETGRWMTGICPDRRTEGQETGPTDPEIETTGTWVTAAGPAAGKAVKAAPTVTVLLTGSSTPVIVVTGTSNYLAAGVSMVPAGMATTTTAAASMTAAVGRVIVAGTGVMGVSTILLAGTEAAGIVAVAVDCCRDRVEYGAVVLFTCFFQCACKRVWQHVSGPPVDTHVTWGLLLQCRECHKASAAVVMHLYIQSLAVLILGVWLLHVVGLLSRMVQPCTS